jgi:menaquinone-dependent protoporphyrinogen oxidase
VQEVSSLHTGAVTAAALVFSTTDGHTAKICERMADVMRSRIERVTVTDVRATRELDLAAFDLIVIGASVRYGRHAACLHEFISRHRALLDTRSNAFFSVNLTARKPAKNQPDTNPYVRKFVDQTAWRPQRLAVFAGKLAYPRYQFFDRSMIRLIMKMTGGPTDPTMVVDYTDWGAVDAFSLSVIPAEAGMTDGKKQNPLIQER